MVNNKFWESAVPGDDIRVVCSPDDYGIIDDTLRKFALAVKIFGPFPIEISQYLDHGTIIFINKSYTKPKLNGLPDWVKDFRPIYPGVLARPIIRSVSS